MAMEKLHFYLVLLAVSSSYGMEITNPIVGPVQAQATFNKTGCPKSSDIHPCECLEIPGPASVDGTGIETVVFCKTIRNLQVLQNAMKGMEGHYFNYMVFDSCKLPPFPNGLFFNINIKWMEFLNTTVQFQNNFMKCAGNCL